MAFTAGQAYVSVVPSFAGAQRAISRNMQHIGTTAGRAAGSNLARNLGTSAAATLPRAVMPLSRGFDRVYARAENLATNAGSRVGRMIGSGMTTALGPLGRLRDGFASSAVAASRFSGMAGSVGGTLRRGFDMVHPTLARVGAGFRGLGTRIGAAMATARERIAGTHSVMGGMVRTLGVIAAAAGLWTLGRAAFQSAADIERSRAALTGLYGDADQARDMIGRLREIARNSSIEFAAFRAGAESLAYMGIQGDQAINVLQRIETAMVASGKGGESFNQVTEAMLAMVNQGKASALQINRMSQAGFPAWEMLATHMGVSIEQIRERVSAGEVSIHDMVAAMESGAGPTFQRMIAAQEEGARTLSATWARVKDNIVVTLGEAISPLLGRMTPALERIGSAVDGGIGRIPETFQRLKAVMDRSGVTDAIGRVAGGFADIVRATGPAFRGFIEGLGSVLGGLLLALGPVGDLMSRLAGWMRENSTYVGYLGAVLGGLVAGLIAVKIAVGAVSVAMAIWAAITSAHPISLIVIAIAGLVAGLIYAYKHSETFRNIVNGAWNAIKATVSAVWNGFLKPVFNAIGTAISWVIDHWKWFAAGALLVLGPVGLVIAAFLLFRDRTMAVLRAVGGFFATVFGGIATAARWLWEGGIRPFINQIWTGLQLLGAILYTVIVAPWLIMTNAVAAAARWLWESALRPAFNAIAAGARWMWNNAIKPAWDAWMAGARIVAGVLRAVFAGIMTSLRAVGDFFRWVWAAVIRPAWEALGAGIRAVWRNVIAPAWAGLRATLDAVGRFFWWVWNSVIRPAWTALGDGIRWVWTSIIRPAWDALRAALRGVGDFFWAVWNNVIRPAWTALGDGIRGVWRNVIRPAWDALVGGLEWVRDRFRDIVATVGRKWNELKGLLARPINAVIRTVFNEGIIRAWNFAAGLLPGVNEVQPLREFRWARGGIHEDHRAQITPAGGPIRIWSEPETHGEAYIPLAATKRQRSVGVLADVADRFGLTVLPKTAGELATFADGGVWRTLWGRVSGRFPRARLSSAYRPGDRGHHGTGRAVDIAGPTPAPRGSAFMADVNRWIANTYGRSAAELIYTPGINLYNGRAHRYNASTQRQHYNHVHWAVRNLFAGAAGAAGAEAEGGGFFGFLRDQIRNFAESVTNPLIDLLPKPPPRWRNIPRELGTTVRDKVLDFLLGKADEVDGGDAGPSGGAGVERWRGLVENMLRLVGQPLVHTNRTLRRMNQESGGNPRAINNWDINARRGTPSKGLMQVIDPTFRAYRHPLLPNNVWNPAANIAASMRYALRRYGSLPRAYDRAGGYDQGGMLMPGWSMVYNGTRRPEPVLTDQQWRDITRAAGGTGGTGDTAPFIGALNVATQATADQAIDSALFKARVAARSGRYAR